MNSIELPPYAPILMESTRAIGYTLESAIADIIDNSIAAGADKIEIHFNPYDEPIIAIFDNGCGMNKDKLVSSMRYGTISAAEIRKDKDLGRFGLGMKTASLSQCRKLTVISKADNKINACRWDLDYIRNTGKWSLICLDYDEIKKQIYVDELNKVNSGTIIIWQNFDKYNDNNINGTEAVIEMMDNVNTHLSLVFHRYLEGEPGLKKIKISINENEIKPIDPFLKNKSQQLSAPEKLKIDNEDIIVTPYLLPHLSSLSSEEIKMLGGDSGLRKNQGFYVYRNKRLLTWGTWFKLAKKEELNKLARVRIDIPNTLDSQWTLDIKKSRAFPPYSIRKNLRSITEKICGQSKRTWNFRGKRETDKSIEHIWEKILTRGGITYQINKFHPLVAEVMKDMNDSSKFEDLIDMIDACIPINQIYSDLSSDRKINEENRNKINEEAVKDLAAKILKNKEGEERNFYIDLLEKSEPFNSYKEVINNLRGEFKSGIK